MASRSKPWSDEENRLIVDIYFEMLENEIVGRSYKKTEYYRRLGRQIDRRKAAMEYKLRNISFVMKGLGKSRLGGLAPLSNAQKSLRSAVTRRLNRHSDFEETALMANPTGHGPGSEGLVIIPGPPALQDPPSNDECKQLQSLAQEFDVAGRDARNRALGLAGEGCVYAHERASLTRVGRPDLAEQVRWVSKEDGDGAGYDIRSYSHNGKPRLIEVKTTSGWEWTPFYISPNELSVAEQRLTEWRLVRLWNFLKEPMAFELQPPLDRHVELTPASFAAHIRQSA